MSFKKASVIILSLLLLLSGGGIWLATKINTRGVESFVGGPQFYPMMLLGLVIIFCVWDMAVTLKEKDGRRLAIPEIKRVIISILLVAVWIALWKYAVGFYPASIIMVFIMLCYLSPEKGRAKKLKIAAITDLILMGSVYIIFSVLFTVRF